MPRELLLQRGVLPTVTVMVNAAKRPIKPVRGPQLRPENVMGTVIVASRTRCAGKPDPATRIFVGDVDGLEPGDSFDTCHAVNGMDCGVWTVSAVITDGLPTGGAIAEGIASYMVNELF